jgi:hypothetical protein
MNLKLQFACPQTQGGSSPIFHLPLLSGILAVALFFKKLKCSYFANRSDSIMPLQIRGVVTQLETGKT